MATAPRLCHTRIVKISAQRPINHRLRIHRQASPHRLRFVTARAGASDGTDDARRALQGIFTGQEDVLKGNEAVEARRRAERDKEYEDYPPGWRGTVLMKWDQLFGPVTEQADGPPGGGGDGGDGTRRRRKKTKDEGDDEENQTWLQALRMSREDLLLPLSIFGAGASFARRFMPAFLWYISFPFILWYIRPALVVLKQYLNLSKKPEERPVAPPLTLTASGALQSVLNKEKGISTDEAEVMAKYGFENEDPKGVDEDEEAQVPDDAKAAAAARPRDEARRQRFAEKRKQKAQKAGSRLSEAELEARDDALERMRR